MSTKENGKEEKDDDEAFVSNQVADYVSDDKQISSVKKQNFGEIEYKWATININFAIGFTCTTIMYCWSFWLWIKLWRKKLNWAEEDMKQLEQRLKDRQWQLKEEAQHLHIQELLMQQQKLMNQQQMQPHQQKFEKLKAYPEQEQRNQSMGYYNNNNNKKAGFHTGAIGVFRLVGNAIRKIPK